MPFPLLHVGAVITCTHGAPVIVVPSSRRVLVSMQPVATIADVHTVVAALCLFQVPAPPGTKPQPCVIVETQPSRRVFIGVLPAAVLTPTTLCKSVEQIPQGPPNAGGIQRRIIVS